MMDIQIGKKYKDRITQNIYVVLNIGLASWNSDQCLIVYQQMGSSDKTVWVQGWSEFNKKFEEARNGDFI